MSAFTDRLIEIDYLDRSYPYEWDEWHAYYDPQTRMYFTGVGAGCSCDYYDEEDLVDESNGLTREAVLREADEYASGEYGEAISPSDLLETKAKIRTFTPPKEVPNEAV